MKGRALEYLAKDELLHMDMLDKGYVPFGQVESHNEKSLAMQKKLGLKISRDKLYWLINF